ncbi:hypothetical protein [Sedimentibacter sp.]|uniref:hypothetical protein n=1 Tax=Sedimentibacter sp. TaxID=1960295 RepID=UPI002899CA5F|nr:hypothetical protein [Sedimentibacter sp.]
MNYRADNINFSLSRERVIFGVGPTTLFYFSNNIKTYYYWQRRVCNAVCNELAIANGNKAVPVFAEVKIPAGRSLDVAITMNINNISLQIHNGAEERVTAKTLR